MPPPWTVGRQKLEQKKLQCSAGWVGYPALTAEEVSLYQARTYSNSREHPIRVPDFVYLSTTEVRIVDGPQTYRKKRPDHSSPLPNTSDFLRFLGPLGYERALGIGGSMFHNLLYV